MDLILKKNSTIIFAKKTDGNIVVASLYETAATEKDDNKLVGGTYE